MVKKLAKIIASTQFAKKKKTIDFNATLQISLFYIFTRF